MKIQRSCREVTRLLLAGEDRPLTLGERLAVRLHMTICDNCTRVAAQLELMRGALQRWRGYADKE